MPFRRKNAPGMFQRAADILIAGVKWKFALVYLDDIIVYSYTLDHYDHLRDVLRIIQPAGLTSWTPKFYSFHESVDYLGHVIQPGSLAVPARHREEIELALPPPHAKGSVHLPSSIQC